MEEEDEERWRKRMRSDGGRGCGAMEEEDEERWRKRRKRRKRQDDMLK